MSVFSLYIHIPYCYHKCPYCDFNTYALPKFPEKEYIRALSAELDTKAIEEPWKQKEITTIYFGGGTPSVFSPEGYSYFLKQVRSRFALSEDIEISLEANPGGIPFEVLQGYRALGINRISFGAQSMHSKTLQQLGRTHTPENIESALRSAREAGFRNVNLDLMFGAPGQTFSDLKEDLDQYLALKPEHISAYGLTIEKGTPFYNSFHKGILKLPEEEESLQMFTHIRLRLRESGYQQYEISNFAQGGCEARHNLAYWNGGDYLGLGAGAHSFYKDPTQKIYGRRWSDIAHPERYRESVSATGKAESWSETLDRSSGIFEFFFLGLRKMSGISLTSFTKQFGCDPHLVYPGLIESLLKEQLLSLSDDKLSLSEKGISIADSVIESFANPKQT